uniref:Phosphatidylinositol-3,4,5-trisphosphate dependent Rac exchange factor 1 n=1 Tax=Spermophilus dauricus TaxID=99837 RepID=A0A8C9PGT2_SPEDA
PLLSFRRQPAGVGACPARHIPLPVVSQPAGARPPPGPGPRSPELCSVTCESHCGDTRLSHLGRGAFLHRIRQNAADSVEKGLTDENVKILFSNIEDILEVHKDFLAALECCLHPEPQSQHELGNVFLRFKDKFCVYEEYCSNHEKALRLLVELNKAPAARAFLLSCMLLGGRKTTDIPLEGYLLSPIQRICKYPLLLKELAKRTPGKHPDHPAVQSALQAMKTVCSNINETKRQMEKLEALEQLQSHIEGWEGSNLTDICTQLLLQGTLLKISAGNIQERAFFLFDNLLVYCKRKSRVTGSKKSTKRTKSTNGSLYIFRGRINTEVMEVENVEDGTADYHSNGYTVTNGWKIHNTAKNKWFVCMAKTAEEKQKWLDAIIREREQRESLKLGMERDAYVMIAEKGEKLYHLMMSKKVNLIKDRRRKLSTVPKCFLGKEITFWLGGGVPSLTGRPWFPPVSDKHQFKNEQVMYRFRYDDGTYKARSELEDIMSKVGGPTASPAHLSPPPPRRDRDYHLKTYKSVLPGSKLVDWLGDCQTREEAVALGVGLCNNGFMHHVLEKSEFKDESQYFRFHADEEMEGTNSKNRQLRNDFKLVENILAKRLLILPQEEDYGFDIEEKNKAVVVKSVQRGSLAEMAGLQVGRRIYSINEDLVFLRPFSEVESLLNQCFCSRRPLRLLVATKAKECLRWPALPAAPRRPGPASSAAPPGSEAMAAGLCAGQCVLKVNGDNVASEGRKVLWDRDRGSRQGGVGLYHWIYHTHEETLGEDLGALEDDQPDSGRGRRGRDRDRAESCSVPVSCPPVGLGVGGRAYEYVSTAGVKCHVLERIVEPRGCFGLAAKVLEAFAAEDSAFVQNCGRLMARSSAIVTMPHFEFHNICDTKLESIGRRIACYQKFAAQLRSRVSPAFKQAALEPHPLCDLDFCPTNCHVNLMEVSYPKTTPSVGRSFSIRFGRKPSLIGLDPEQGHLNPMSYTQHCITTMAAPSWKCLPAVDGDPNGQALNDSLALLPPSHQKQPLDGAGYITCLEGTIVRVLLSTITEPTPGGACDPPLAEEASSSSLVSEESEMDRTDHGSIKKVCFKVSEEDQEDSGHDTMSYRDSYSECNSNRDSVLSYTSVRSNSSYLGSDEMGSGDELPCDMRIPSDKQDKLHGCLEHLFNQVDAINTLLKGPVMGRAFEETRHFPMEHSLPEFKQKEECMVRGRSLIQISIQEDPWNLPSSIKTLVDNIQRYVEDGKNQLLLALLKCTGEGFAGFGPQLVQGKLGVGGTRGPSCVFLQKEERTMLEDVWVTLSELDNVSFSFKQLDESYVANTNVSYHIEGGRQALRVVFYLDSYHFSKLPSRLESGASLRLHTVLFTKALENVEGPSPAGSQAAEDLQQEVNAQSLEKVQQYYRKLRAFYLERSNLPSDASTTAVKIDQLIRPINALDELCRLMKSLVHPTPGAGGSFGASLIPVSSELCYRLGACQMALCGTGMQRGSQPGAVLLPRGHWPQTDTLTFQGPRVEILAKNLRVKDQMPQGAPR